MRPSNFMWFLGICLHSQLVCSETLTEKIDALIEQKLPHATVGVLIKDAKTGDVIYSRNADKLLSPASSTKLFTTAAALYQLQPSYRFLTKIAQKGSDFYITFSGSPSFTNKNLTDLILSLKNNNTTTIKGNIILDTERFKPPYYPGGVSYDDLGWYYSAPTTAAVINENAVSYDFISAKELGKPIQIIPKKPSKGLTIINQVVTVSKEDAKDHCDLNIKVKSNNTLHLFGCLAQTKDPRTMDLAVPNPNLLVRQQIKEILDKNSIVLKGTITKGHTPEDAQVLTQFQSGALNKLITHMLRYSDNLYANSLTKQLGYSVTGNGSHKQGMFAMKKVLAEHTHLDMKQVELADGMGTRYNLATPEQMVILLSDLYNDKTLGPILLNALPKAGVSGTLKDRMKKTVLENKVLAKTGTMHDISSLSGFLINPNAKSYIFSIMINGVNKPINTAKSLEEQILLAVEEGTNKK